MKKIISIAFVLLAKYLLGLPVHLQAGKKMVFMLDNPCLFNAF
jgi:hypothetical protein